MSGLKKDEIDRTMTFQVSVFCHKNGLKVLLGVSKGEKTCDRGPTRSEKSQTPRRKNGSQKVSKPHFTKAN